MLKVKKISNKFFENIFRKNFNDKNWDVRLPVFVIKVKGKIIKHLKFSSKKILFSLLPKTSAITYILRTLPGRDISFWVTELLNFIAPVSHLCIYFQYRIKIHDIMVEELNK